jgi:hypothetical protein
MYKFKRIIGVLGIVSVIGCDAALIDEEEALDTADPMSEEGGPSDTLTHEEMAAEGEPSGDPAAEAVDDQLAEDLPAEEEEGAEPIADELATKDDGTMTASARGCTSHRYNIWGLAPFDCPNGRGSRAILTVSQSCNRIGKLLRGITNVSACRKGAAGYRYKLVRFDCCTQL